jgi:transcriptional antiterminator NusG
MEVTTKTTSTTPTSSARAHKWYVIKVQANKEKSVSEKLKSEIEINKLERSVLNILVPTEKTFFMKDGKKTSREKIMYPGYIFIETNALGEIKQMLRDLSAGGFLKTKSGEIEALKQSEIDNILGKISEKSDEEKKSYIINEEVKIIDGPFNGFKGKISDIRDTKVFVGVSIFGRVNNMELRIEQIEKLNG